ncbi:MAG: ABC transporter substrate-binding protein, partial [Pseudonocardia sp.]
MWRPRTNIAVGAILALATVSACSTPTDSPAGGGENGIVVALAEAPDALDPTTAQTFVGTIVLSNICEALYDIDESLKVVPELATALPEISPDGLTYTIPLRSGVTFNDGTPFDAQAVKTTLERGKNDPKSSRSADLAPLTSVEVVDPTTVKLTLNAPNAPFTAALAGRIGMIQSPTQLEKLGSDFSQHPVCVGPFEFSSRPSAEHIEVVRSDDYYAKDTVALDKVTFQTITQANVRAANLRSGEVDIAERLSPTDSSTLEAAPDIALQQV